MVRFSRKKASGGDIDILIVRNPPRLLPDILGREIGDSLNPDIYAFYQANPFNFGHLGASALGVSESLYYDEDLTDEQVESLLYAAAWHAPVWGVHIAHKLGAFAGHTGGFGYYRSLGMFPRLAGGIIIPQAIHYGMKLWLGRTDQSGVIHGHDVTRSQRIQQYS